MYQGHCKQERKINRHRISQQTSSPGKRIHKPQCWVGLFSSEHPFLLADTGTAAASILDTQTHPKPAPQLSQFLTHFSPDLSYPSVSGCQALPLPQQEIPPRWFGSGLLFLICSPHSPDCFPLLTKRLKPSAEMLWMSRSIYNPTDFCKTLLLAPSAPQSLWEPCPFIPQRLSSPSMLWECISQGNGKSLCGHSLPALMLWSFIFTWFPSVSPVWM